MEQRFQQKILIGALEICDLPELKIKNLHVRVDTGAATSSLHVDNIETFNKEGQKWVSFDISPDIHNVKRKVRTTLPVENKTRVKSSSANSEKRIVITTTILLGGREWPIRLNLTDRSEMTYLMLLGREAMQGKLMVDPELEYVLDHDYPEFAPFVHTDSEEE